MRRTTRRELVVATGAGALGAAVPPAWGRLTAARPTMTPGAFRDGVASGEPGTHAITFWSRLHSDRQRAAARLLVATDAGMRNVVAHAVVPTGQGVNWTLKARVGGLRPDHRYYFQWESTNAHSPVGMTGTRAPDPGRLRIGFSSCQNFIHGYFSPHADAAAQDLDAYLFLGDYVYEYGTGTDTVREDGINAVDLASYRAKYRTYRTDAGLRELHRVHPVLHVWDDHDVGNDYSDNDPYAAPSQRVDAFRAAFEWLPHQVFPADRFRLWRRHSFGPLADVFQIDTRQYRTGDLDGQPRHIMQEAQMRWLIEGLTTSKAVWKLVANQVVITHRRYIGDGEGDQWDGYEADRQRLLSAIEAAGVRNVVFLTGDAHVFLCGLVGTDPAALAADPGRVPAAVEYVGGSITSPGRDRLEAAVRLGSPWIQQYNGHEHGYGLLDISADELVVDFRGSDLTRPDGATRTFERFTQPVNVNRVARRSFA